jgi:hypothetical protein
MPPRETYTRLSLPHRPSIGFIYIQAFLTPTKLFAMKKKVASSTATAAAGSSYLDTFLRNHFLPSSRFTSFNRSSSQLRSSSSRIGHNW